MCGNFGIVTDKEQTLGLILIEAARRLTYHSGRAIAIGQDDPCLRANTSDVILIPTAPPLVSSLLSVIPLQLLTYHMSIRRGYDPDFPRNLSKTLTVD